MDNGDLKQVGVNLLPLDEEPILLPQIYEPEKYFNPRILEIQREKIEKIRRERSEDKVQEALEEVTEAARRGDNVMPAVMKAVKARAMLYEVAGIWRKVWGIWEPIWERV